jgi:hypothetical protein
VVLVDWAGSGLAGRFGGDRIHIGPVGEAVLARFIRRRSSPFMPPRALTLPDNVADAVKACGTVHRGGRMLGVYVIRGRRKILCGRAREVVRASQPRAVAGWHWFDWAVVGRRPWLDVYERPSGEVLIASTAARPQG